MLHATPTRLAGYEYGTMSAPVGDEWNNPQKIAYNKEQPRAWFFSFQDEASARKVLPENSPYWLSLNGQWKFHWAADPDHRPVRFYETSYDVSQWDDVIVPMNWNVYGLQKDGTQKYGTPIYTNTKVIFQHEIKVDDWKKGVMQTPPTNWTTYKHRNEVGSYRRTFNIPSSWKGQDIHICFDGVDSFFYLWINGHYIGFSKNSRNAARFNITPYVKKGENMVAIEVYRNSDGSYLEAQDMFRLPGIFRDVSLTATPRVAISDLNVICDMDEDMDAAVIKVKTLVTNSNNKEIKDYKINYKLFANKIYSDENEPAHIEYDATQIKYIGKQQQTQTSTNLFLSNPNIWTAETPLRYTLVAFLQDGKGKTVQTVSTYFGIRKVGIRKVSSSFDEFNIPGSYFFINGESVKLKGVNRHETHPSAGHAIDRKQMEQEIMLMKRGNVNTVRTSHYPDAPYWYYLCDKYGIYLVSEANIESHEYRYGPESLSHPVEWRNAHVDRVMEMAHAYFNSPSIIIWSLGNEAGPGLNFQACYDSLKAYDPDRPIHYERNNGISDFGSCMYPSIEWTRKASTGKEDIKYPFFICEYAHSMGNAVGNLSDYWKAIESTNFVCGGCIWDWIDQGIYYYDSKSGKQYIAYGGDFGDEPNDGQFVMNGILFSDLSPKPQYYEMKKVYQNIEVDSINLEHGYFTIFNKNYFTTLDDYQPIWKLYKNGTLLQQGELKANKLIPRQRITVQVPYDVSKFDINADYQVRFEFRLRQDKPWARKGFIQAEEQFTIRQAAQRPTFATAGKVKLQEESQGILSISGNGFSVQFDTQSGTIHSLQYGGLTIIPKGCGPQIEAFRAFVNNDNWLYKSWFSNGLHNLKPHATLLNKTENPDGSVSLAFNLMSQAPYGSRLLGSFHSGRNTIEDLKDSIFGKEDFHISGQLTWTIFADGSIQLQSCLTPNKAQLVLGRIGYVMQVPKSLSQFTYYGRGPKDNYPDRKDSQFMGIYSITTDSMMHNWCRPQDSGNREDVQWCAVTDQHSRGAVFITNHRMSTSLLPNSDMDMVMTSHPYQLPKRENNFLHLDVAVTGLGGNSCGQGPLEKDRIMGDKAYPFSLLIRPVNNIIAQQVTVVPAESEFK